MKSLQALLANIEENIITLLLPIMCLVVFMSTFFRFTGLLIIPWGEELARYLLVWIVFLGLGTGAKANKHFGVGQLVKIMPKWTHKYFALLKTVIVSLFCGYVIYLSVNLIQAQIKMQQTSPALNLPIWLAYLAVPVGLGLMGFRTIQYYVKQTRQQDGDVN